MLDRNTKMVLSLPEWWWNRNWCCTVIAQLAKERVLTVGIDFTLI
jgi:hypothetical protein